MRFQADGHSRLGDFVLGFCGVAAGTIGPGVPRGGMCFAPQRRADGIELGTLRPDVHLDDRKKKSSPAASNIGIRLVFIVARAGGQKRRFVMAAQTRASMGVSEFSKRRIPPKQGYQKKLRRLRDDAKEPPDRLLHQLGWRFTVVGA